MAGDFGIGAACCAVAAVGFGSNYLPVKQVDCGDGFFFAAMMAVGIASVGVVVNYSMLTSGPFFDSPRFEPFAMVGGAAWMVGNLMTPTIIRLVGLGIGLSIWDLSNMVMGWATGYFGLFGVWRESVTCPWMNYLGLALAGVSLVLFAQAMEPPSEAASAGSADAQKGDKEEKADKETADAGHDVVGDLEGGHAQGRKPIPRAGTTLAEASTAASVTSTSGPAQGKKPIPRVGTTLTEASTAASIASTPSKSEVECPSAAGSNEQEEFSTQASSPEMTRNPSPEPAVVSKPGKKARQQGLSAVAPWKLQALGFVMAIVTGMLFGYTFDTSITLMENGDLGGPHSRNPMDYVLSHFCGILAMGLASLLVYVAVRRGRSYTPRKLVLPSVFSGVLWGIAQASWFRANQELSVVVAFPIVSSLPGIVALAWGFFCFGELRSMRSRRFAVAGLAFRLPSVLLIALSDQVR